MTGDGGTTSNAPGAGTPRRRAQPSPRPPATIVAASTGTLGQGASAIASYQHIPARALDAQQSRAILDDMVQRRWLRAEFREIRSNHRRDVHVASMPWGAEISQLQVPDAQGALVPFRFRSADAMDYRLAVMIHRIATHVHQRVGAIELTHEGLYRPLNRDWLDSHNQGRAIDLTGLVVPQRTPGRPGDAPLMTVTVRQYWGGIPLASSDEGRNRGQRPAPHPVITGYSAIQNYIQQTQSNRPSGHAPPALRLVPLTDTIAFDRHWYATYAAPTTVPPQSDDMSGWTTEQRMNAGFALLRLDTARRALWALLDALFDQATLQGQTAEGAYAIAYPTLSRTNPVGWGHVVHPDYKGPEGRPIHQEHIHAQVGPGGWITTFQGDPVRGAQIPQDARDVLRDDAIRAVNSRLYGPERNALAAYRHAHSPVSRNTRAGRTHPDEAPPPDGFDQTEQGIELRYDVLLAHGYRSVHVQASGASAGPDVTVIDVSTIPEFDADTHVHVQGRILTYWASASPLNRRRGDRGLRIPALDTYRRQHPPPTGRPVDWAAVEDDLRSHAWPQIRRDLEEALRLARTEEENHISDEAARRPASRGTTGQRSDGSTRQPQAGQSTTRRR
jgi:hypothetical protein